MKEKTIRYYSDERTNDFANNQIQTKELPESFRYVNHSILYRILTFAVYRILVTPAVFLYIQVKYHHRVKNKKVLKQAGTQGFFLYGNHTNGDLDAFVPTLISFPKKAYIIVNPDATSIKGIQTLVMMLGALPLPNGLELFKKFLKAISERVSGGSVVTIYPEAHIWPYYTDIRDFNPSSLAYAYMNDKPVFCFTNIYRKQKLLRRPQVVTYIDGPFYCDMSRTKKENVAMLKEQVHAAMKKRVRENPKYEYKYVYVKKPSGK